MPTRDKYSYDAIVIGAGPAGSTAAYMLASDGFKVLIMDKAAFPRDKLCGGLLTVKSIKLLEDIFSTPVDFLKSRQVVTYQSTSYKVGSSGGAFIKGHLNEPFHFVQRKTYDQFWLEKARGAGATFQAGESVVMLDPDGKQITTESGRQFRAEFILGADGALSRTRHLLIARRLIESVRKSELASTLEVIIPSHGSARGPDYPAIYYGYIPWGYAWSFPGKHYRIIGIAGLNRKAGKLIRSGFRRFLEGFDFAGRDVPVPKSHPLPYGNYLARPGYGNVLLLGDACGLADPLLGEGVYYAHKSACLAARAIRESYGRPSEVLMRYSYDLTREIIAELKYIRFARQIVFSLPGNLGYLLLSVLLRTIPRFCEETIQGRRSYRWFRRTALGNKKTGGRGAGPPRF